MAGTGDIALARHARGFDGEQFATDFGPGQAGDLPDLVVFLGHAVGVTLHAEILFQIARSDADLALGFLQRQRGDCLAADLGDFAFHAAHAGLARVVTHDVAQRGFADMQIGFCQAVVLQLLGQQITLGDIDLLVLGVAGKSDHFHPVEQRRGNVERVGGGDKHHVGKVVIDLDIMVLEGVVLLRIEHFEQRR